MKALTISEDTKQNIIQELMLGTPLTKICQAKDMPSLATFYRFLAKHKEFANEIAFARKTGAQTLLDRMITELDNADNKNIMVVREKLQHYRWLSSKLLPSIYGDKQEIVTDNKIEITWNTNANTNTNTIEAKVIE